MSDAERTTSALNDASPSLRGDICPAWCNGTHIVDRFHPDGRPMHPDDAGVHHESTVIDEWVPEADGVQSNDPIKVYISGFRHDNGDNWPDSVYADGDTNTSGVGGVELPLEDAARLARALLRACELMEEH